MFIEMGMMQQLSIFLGQPIYAMVVVLAGLIISSGVGSLVSDRWKVASSWQSRCPAITACVLIFLYSLVVVPVIHHFTAGVLWQRIMVCLGLIAPCGFLLGFCFPIGMRWMTALSQHDNLPWMWALNGAAGTLGTFLAMLVSMDSSIEACILTGATCYFVAGFILPARVVEVRDLSQAAALGGRTLG
jgi:hypothetical protein